jgi:hypothetical protein
VVGCVATWMENKPSCFGAYLQRNIPDEKVFIGLIEFAFWKYVR